MKKIALFCAVLGMAVGVMADDEDGLKFKFSSSGDRYADGSSVLDGEAYALVWVADKASFAGFNADGTLVDAENNSLEAVSVAQDGGCITTVFIVDKKAGGAYYMCLLDTRATVSDAAGNVTTNVTGLVGGKITTVREVIAVENPKFDLVSSESSTLDGTKDTAVAAAVPSNVEQPVVVGFALTTDGGAVLDVSGTVPYVQYTVYGGASVTAIDTTKPLATFLNGKVSGNLELKVPNVGGNRFFKVAAK